MEGDFFVWFCGVYSAGVSFWEQSYLYFVLSFLAGLSIGLFCLLITRLRSGARRKALLERFRIEPEAQFFSYEAQIASAISNQSSTLNDLQTEVNEINGVLQQAPVGYLKVDQENRLLWCNAKARYLLGIEPVSYTHLTLPTTSRV